MRILKPNVLFKRFPISYCHINDRFDIRRFSTLFQAGICHDYGNKLVIVDYKNNHIYDKLPRFIRFQITEAAFSSFVFKHDEFYDYGENKDFICYQYCEELIHRLPESKKIKKLMKEIKDKIPEYFI